MTFTDWYRPVGMTPECDSLLLGVPSHVAVSTGPSAWGSRRDRQGCHLRSAILIGFLASTKFATTFTSYMDSFAMWTAAWGVIVSIDFFVVNRGRADVPALYESLQRSRYGDIRWRSLFALLVGLVGGWTFEYGGVPLFQGPIARATDGLDFSWLAEGAPGRRRL